MAVVTGVFLDTSVLPAGLIEMGPGSRSAQEVMTALAEGRLRRPRTALQGDANQLGWHWTGPAARS